jgi:hypothetical protein
MAELLKSKGYQKKGTALFIQSGIAASITTNGFFKIATTEMYNDSDSITVISDEEIQLKAGKKYKLKASLSVDTSGSSYINYKLYNSTISAVVGTIATINTSTRAESSGANTTANLIIAPTVDTKIKLQHLGADTTTAYTTSLEVEEVEAYNQVINYQDHNSLTNRDAAGSHSSFTPLADSTTAFQFLKADGVTPVLGIDSINGRVGIGTASPSQRLEVYSTTSSTAGFIATGEGIAGLVRGKRLNGTSASPTAILSGENVARFVAIGQNTDGNSTPCGDMSIVAEANFGAVNNAPTALVFSTSSTTALTEKMRITSAGNVGIGNVSPYAISNYVALTIGDNDAAKAGLIKLSSTYNSGSGAEIFQLANGDFAINSNPSTRVLTITAAGLIKSTQTYANTSAGVSNLGVSIQGEFYRSTSALKYKKDVEDLPSDDSKIIYAMRPVIYNSACENEESPEYKFAGLIADEVDKLGDAGKRLVTYNNEGEVEGFQYERLTVYLLKEIQELKKEIDKIKGDNA